MNTKSNCHRSKFVIKMESDLILSMHVSRDAEIIDIGDGDSNLADKRLFQDITYVN